MKVVSLASVRGAPGVTTTAILLASTFTDGLVVEADRCAVEVVDQGFHRRVEQPGPVLHAGVAAAGSDADIERVVPRRGAEGASP